MGRNRKYNYIIKAKIVFVFWLVVLMLSCCSDKPVRILILSGNNNHDWQNTTPLIRETLLGNLNCKVDITERPDTMNVLMLKSFDVIVSNWNAWPELNGLWNPEAKQAFEDFIKQGGGFVCIHAASATHYDWPPYLEIAGGRWGDKTHHGLISDCVVRIVNQEHPITKGMSTFTIRDELWVDIECSPSVEVLCAVQAEEYAHTPGKLEPVALITQYGKGRGFYLALGHDTFAMSNPGWQNLLVRGAQWAAKREVLSSLIP
jgi:type 1 glutamine amidotransferase